MFKGHARLRAVERGQVCAYPLGPRLPHMAESRSTTGEGMLSGRVSGGVLLVRLACGTVRWWPNGTLACDR
jgi:hypothetical protein